MADQPERHEPLSAVKQALLEIRRLRARVDEAERVFTEPVAIVGIGCRFPGDADDPAAFWRVLRDGVDAVTEIPRERWDIERYYDPDPEAPGRMYTRHGAFLRQVDRFDPGFFGISPREAAGMDPQQRLVLEVAWEALEHAGLAADRLVESVTGVFVGIGASDYALIQAQGAKTGSVDAYFATGTAHSVAAGRLSYLLGLRGPSVAVDTACSSSLLAVHLACQSLRLGECRMALAAGVNVILWPEIMVNFSRARMMSASGRCHTFAAAADGYVRGEGCGVVVLKRLSDALAEGDRVLAVIRGSAANQDGRTSGLTVPNGPAQEALIRQALAAAHIEPARVSYVETHGTGTALGDPIEVRALGAALGVGRAPGECVAIGSVKTNIGHLEAAAGIAGLIKVVLCLQHGELPAHLHFHTPSPHIPWAELPVEVVAERRPWMVRGGPRVAGVSSFGFSGTNVHVIVEEPPVATTAQGGERPAYLFPLSAKSDAALRVLAGRLARHVVDDGGGRLADLCFTAAVGRTHHAHRAAVVAATTDELRARLGAIAEGRDCEGTARGTGRLGGVPQVAFLFTGQGAQNVGMGLRLYATEPMFRAALDACATALAPHLDRPLLEILAGAPGAPCSLEEALYAQPAVFALEYALASMWRAWGVEPVAVMGHSLGEYAAACVAGVLRLEDAAHLVALRGRLMGALPPGMMAAVGAPEARVAELVVAHGEHAAIAAVNAPEQVVVSGTAAAVQAILARLEADGVRTQRLALTHAFHSPMVGPMLDALADAAAAMEHRNPELALVSNVTGRLVDAGEMGAAYWQDHARRTVRFADGLATLRAEGVEVFLELGPHPILIPLGPQCVADDATWLGTLRRDEDDWTRVLETLGALYTRGVDVDWAAVDRGFPRRRVELPTYPFQRTRHWMQAPGTLPADDSPRDARVWDDVVSAARRQMNQGPLDLAVGTYPAKWSSLNRLAAGYVAAALAELDCFTRPGERHTLAELTLRWELPPARRQLLSRWLGRLVSEGLLVRRENDFVSRVPLSAASLEALRAEARATLADTPELLQYVERCGTSLAPILAGRESPLETLFPGGSFETTEFLYQTWPVARYMNALIRCAVETWLRAQPADLPLRALEVGAGTGGTTSAVLPALPAHRTIYHFTDVSTFFFAHAEEKLGAYPFVRLGLLDLERDPVQQGWQPGSFHVIIAANVLHATENLDRTLEHVRTLLAPGGLLVAYEATEHLPWFDVTTGLIEGWQRFADGWRQDHPLLAPPRWEAALRAHGFEHIAAFPETGSPAEVLGQHVLVALLPGVAATTDARHALDTTVDEGSRPVSHDGTLAEAKISVFRRQVEAAPLAEQHDLLIAYVRKRVAGVLRLEAPESLDRRQPLMDLGIDSLMALELRKRLGAGLGLTRALPATLVFDHPSIEAIARLLAREMAPDGRVEGEPAPPRMQPRTAEAAPRLAIADVEVMDDEDVQALLLKRLEDLR